MPQRGRLTQPGLWSGGFIKKCLEIVKKKAGRRHATNDIRRDHYLSSKKGYPCRESGGAGCGGGDAPRGGAVVFGAVVQQQPPAAGRSKRCCAVSRLYSALFTRNSHVDSHVEGQRGSQ